VGVNAVVREVVAHIAAAPELGLRVAGYVTDEWPPDPPPLGRHLGPVSALKAAVATEKPQRIVVGLPERRDRVPVGDLLQLRLSGVAIEEAASAYERICQRICLRELRPSQLIFSGDLGPHEHRSLAQAGMDYGIALAAVLLASPLLLLAALAVKFASPGPVLERQARVGRNGAPFDRLEFRVPPGRAGRLLVRLRCHRLPRLFNILRGEMSIVGPHPERPELVEARALQVPYYRHRLSVLPGLTGWAQVNHGSTGQLEDAVINLEYDLYYIKNHSWRMDAFLILDAVKSALLRRAE
jgi:lipopolysaccharide/colanic/teichoic acid biosynthesis glycosyltransferase